MLPGERSDKVRTAGAGFAAAVLLTLGWVKKKLSRAPAVLGTARATRKYLTLKSRGPRRKLTITLAPPPARCTPHPVSAENPPVVLYVLDPEPALFGAATLQVYAQAGYFSGCPLSELESAYGRVHVVGIGWPPEEYDADQDGWDRPQLVHLRRRDLPPFDHPMVKRHTNRGPNAEAQRFVCAICDEVIPYAEAQLGLDKGVTPRRALMGASYSGIMALQVWLHAPALMQDYILGSPSVPFDPEIMERVETFDAGAAVASGAGCIILLGDQERHQDGEGLGGCRLPANVHGELPKGAELLAARLRARGIDVTGVEDIAGEDHATVKLSIVSRGLSWLAQRILNKP